MEDQELLYKKELEQIRTKKYQDLINKIKEEAMKPTCMSLDYDPTPTGEERLRKIVKMIRRFEKDQKRSK